jgi:hypothetical protein
MIVPMRCGRGVFMRKSPILVPIYYTRIVSEPMFVQYRNTWEQVWDLVKRVDRPNFGINLDTFQILGEYSTHYCATLTDHSLRVSTASLLLIITHV